MTFQQLSSQRSIHTLRGGFAGVDLRTPTNLDGSDGLILARVLEISTDSDSEHGDICEEELDTPGQRNHARQGGTTTLEKEDQPATGSDQWRLRQSGQSMGFSVRVFYIF